MHKRYGAVLTIVASGACAGLLWAAPGRDELVRHPWLSWTRVVAGATSDARPRAGATFLRERAQTDANASARPSLGGAPNPRPWTAVAPGASPDRAGSAPQPSQPSQSPLAAPSSSYSMSAPEYLADPAAATAESIAVGDVSGDGRDDLVFMVARHSSNPMGNTEVYVAYQGADGRLAPAVKIADAGHGLENQLLIADLDRDGIGDIVTTAFDNVLVLRSNGSGRFFGSLIPAGDPDHLVATDVDRDGYLDILADSSNTEATVVHGGRDGFGRTSTLALPTSAVRTIGDVTGDGLDDLILGTVYQRPFEEFRIYPALASGGYGAPMVLSLPLGSNFAGALAVGDFNGDGRGDLALEEVRDEAKLRLFLQDAQGTLAPGPELVRQRGYGSLIASDLDRDGRTDLAIAHIGWGYVGYYLQTATGFTPENLIEARQFSARVNFFAAGDLNHDGCGDLVVSRGGQSPVLMYGQGCPSWPIADCRYPPIVEPLPTSAAVGPVSPLAGQRNGETGATLEAGLPRGAGARSTRSAAAPPRFEPANRVRMRMLER